MNIIMAIIAACTLHSSAPSVGLTNLESKVHCQARLVACFNDKLSWPNNSKHEYEWRWSSEEGRIDNEVLASCIHKEAK